MAPASSASWTEADALLQRELSAALGGTRILIYPSFGEIRADAIPDDLFFGKLVWTVGDSPLQLEVALGHSSTVHIDAYLARARAPRTGHDSYAALAMGGELRGIEIERPSERVTELFRRLAQAWLAAANVSGVLDDRVEWRPLGYERPWFVRSLDVDAHLSQLCGEPIGALQLLSPTPLQ